MSAQCRTLGSSVRRCLAAAAVLGVAHGAVAFADEFPSKRIEFVIPFTPGGGVDAAGRTIIQAMRDEGIIDVPVQITNVAGASGQVGINDLVRNRAGDDYTLMVHSTAVVNNPISQGADVNHHDYTVIGRLFSEYVYFMVPPGSPFEDIDQIAEVLRDNPSGLKIAGSSIGNASHQVLAKFGLAIGVDPKELNYIPYDGGEALAAALGGHVDLLLPGPEVLDLVEAGQLVPLAVTSEERLGGRSSDIPTFLEKGYDVLYLNWRGLFAPPDIAPEVEAFWKDAMRRLDESETWKAVLADKEWESTLLTDGFSEWLDSEEAATREVLQSLALIN